MLPYSSYSPLQFQQAVNLQQSQMLNFERFRLGLSGVHPSGYPGYPGAADSLSMGFGFGPFDPRNRFIQEEPKPQHSYIGLIAMAILSSPEKKLVLSDIYQWILDNYPYFRTRGPGWRNSIRHNLSLNDCFTKAGRSANGKGHYWAIHSANVEDFKRGDFRRRRAQRKVRKAMGLSVPDEEDDDDDSPCMSPMVGLLPSMVPRPPIMGQTQLVLPMQDLTSHRYADSSPNSSSDEDLSPAGDQIEKAEEKPPRKRLFDVESLLAPEDSNFKKPKLELSPKNAFTNFELSDKKPQTGTTGFPTAPPNFPPNLFGSAVPFPFAPGAPGFGHPALNGIPWNLAAFGLPMKNFPGVGGAMPFGQGSWPNGAVLQQDKPPADAADRKSPSPNSAERWQETFAKIMARSYHGKQLAANGLVRTPADHGVKLEPNDRKSPE